MRSARRLSDEKDIVMILDEVQTGMGRTGSLFCYQRYGITPDIITLAKSLGGGVPIGACVARGKFADVLTPGTHASTFGGSPLVSAAALAVFEAIEKEKLLQNTKKMGAYLAKQLEGLKNKYHFIKEVRSVGLIFGVELNIKGEDIYRKCLHNGLLINCTQDTVLRIMPPMTVTRLQIDKAVSILDKVLAKQ
jgi:acetylornithine/succinyldiaminopimelate/putrescine aminotransferase